MPEFRKTALLALLVLMVFASLVPQAYAVGIRPARLTYPFEEGKEFLFEYTIINRADAPARFAIYSCGTFWDKLNVTNVEAKTFANLDCTAAQRSILSAVDSGDIKVEDAGVYLNPKEEKKIYIKLKLPAVTGFQPGIVETKVGALDLPLTITPGQTVIGGVAAVEAQLWLRVPYPGKRLVLSPSVEDVISGQRARLKASVISEGTEKVDNAVLTIDILDPDGLRKDRIVLEPKSIASGETVDYLSVWETKGFDPGTYTARFILTFDTQTITEERQFKIGGLQVDVTGVEAEPIQKGGIAKIKIFVTSKWGDSIPNVYADVSVKDKLDDEIAVIKTQAKDLKPYDKTELEAFWESGSAQAGVYDVIATLHYASNQSQGRGTVEIKGQLYQGPSYEYIALAVIIILLLGVLWIFKDRLRLKLKDDEGPKDEQDKQQNKL